MHGASISAVQPLAAAASDADGLVADGVTDAFAYWETGDYDACLEALDLIALAHHTSETIFLRARALLRIARVDEAESWLRMTQTRHSENDAVATNAMLMGAVCARLGKIDRAMRYFECVGALDPHPTIIAETCYYHALAFWATKAFPEARRALAGALTSNHDTITARAQQLLGFIAASEGNFRRSTESFYEALSTLEHCSGRDVHLQAALLHAISIAEAEVTTADPQALDLRAHALPWTANLQTEHAQTLRHTGLAYARAGQPRRAIELFTEMVGIDRVSPWAVMGYAEAADLCRQQGNDLGAHGYLALAQSTAKDVRWAGTDIESRIALLILATVTARFRLAPLATTYLDIYHTDTRSAPYLALSALHRDSDARLAIFEAHAAAVVNAAAGNPIAIRQLMEVEHAWARVGYSYRSREAYADRCNLGSAALSGMTLPATEPIAPADRKLSTGGRNLSDRKTEILRMLVAKKSTADIARELGREQKTVRGHLSELYALFGVTNKSALIATVLTDDTYRMLLTTDAPQAAQNHLTLVSEPKAQ